MEYLYGSDHITEHSIEIPRSNSKKICSKYSIGFLGKHDSEKEIALQLEDISRKLSQRGTLKLKGDQLHKLKKVAANYFGRFNEYERKKLEGNASLGIHADWNGYTVRYRGFDFELKNLLLGFGNTDELRADRISGIVLDLLDSSNVDKQFMGWWKEGSTCLQMLSRYHIDKTRYTKKRRAIDLKSIDTVLEILKLKANRNGLAVSRFSISNKNQIYKLNVLPKGNEAERIFLDKLVARRVLITICKLFQEEPDFDLMQMASILTNDMNSSIGDTNHLTTKTIRYYLGLRRMDHKVVLGRSYILNEEQEFLSSFTTYILPLRRFLNTYTPSKKLLSDIDYNYQGSFLDLSDFNNFVMACTSLQAACFDELIGDVQDFIQNDTKYKGIDDLLSWANPFFKAKS